MPVLRRLSIVDRYFDWLYSHVGLVEDSNPKHSHRLLASELFDIPFKWHVKGDGNREQAGFDMRDAFVDEVGSWENDRFIFEPCTVLELLVALSIKLNFMHCLDEDQRDSGVGVWFWKLCHNLDLDQYTDEAYLSDPLGRTSSLVRRKVNIFLERRYHQSGRGGLFPLKHSSNDQREIEIWYQMSEYLIENYDY